MAIYCEDIGLLYISTPRTACTSTEDLLINHYGGRKICGRKISYKHHCLKTVLCANELSDGLLKVTGIRNTYDSLVSEYHKWVFRHYPQFLHGRDMQFKNNPESFLEVCKWAYETHPSMTDFFLADSRLTDYLLRRPIEICKEVVGRMYDDLIRFEDLQSEVDRVLARLSVGCFAVKNSHKLPVKNVTEQRREKEYRSFYTPLLKRMVDDKCGEYIQATGYEF